MSIFNLLVVTLGRNDLRGHMHYSKVGVLRGLSSPHPAKGYEQKSYFIFIAKAASFPGTRSLLVYF